MSAAHACSECGAAIPAAAPVGLCPDCLFSLGLAAADKHASPAVRSEASEATKSSSNTAKSALGTLHYLGDYELLKEVARGGMGVVFRARQVSLNRIVAVKLISAGALATPESVKRFRVEAEAAAGLTHPNIVPIHEIGEHEGQHYFSMDLVEGLNLSAHLARKPMADVRAAGQLVRTLARAVHFAHQRGILHRDIKPANVILDPAGQPHLTDFGVAKVVQRDSTLTHTHAILGTPAYMAPEQARGDTRSVTTAVDVYGLGAVLYEALTGAAPFGGGTSFETARQVLEQEPRPPSLFNPRVPRDLETICLKCLEKEPLRRYSSAEALAEDLDRWLEHKAIAAHRTTTLRRVGKWVRRQPAIAALSFSLVSLLLSALGVSVWQWRQQAEVAQLARKEQYRAKVVLADTLLRSGRAEQAGEALLTTPEEFRHWEWGFLVAQSFPLLQSFSNSPPGPETNKEMNPVSAVAFSSDARRVVSGDAAGRVTVWDQVSGHQLLCVQAGPQVRKVVLNAKRNLLVAASQGGSVTVWEAESGALLRQYGRQTVLGDCNVSAEGNRFLVCVKGGVRMWDTESGQEIESLGPLAGSGVEWAGTSADGQRLVFGKLESTVVVDTRDGRIVSTVPEGIDYAAVSPDGRYLAGSRYGEALLEFDLDTGKRLCSLPADNEKCIYSPDGRYLASRSTDGTVSLYETRPLRLMRKLARNGNDAFPTAFGFSPDGRFVVTGSRSGSIEIWPPEWAVRSIPQNNRPVAVAVSPDGTRCVVGGADWTSVLFDLQSGTALHWFEGHFQTVLGAAFSPDGRQVATASYDHTLKLWDAESGRELRSFHGHSAPVQDVVFHPKAPRLFSAGSDGSVRAWNTATGAADHCYSVHSNILRRLAIDASGETLLVGAVDGVAKLIRTDTGEEKLKFSNAGARIMAVAFQPGKPAVAIAAANASVRLFDSLSGALLRTLPTYDAAIAVQFSSDGRRFFAFSSSGTSQRAAGRIELWDTGDWTQIASFPAKDHFRWAASLAGNDRLLCTLGSMGDLCVWESLPWDRGAFSHDRSVAPAESIRKLVRATLDRPRMVRASPPVASAGRPRFQHPRDAWPRRDPAAPAGTIDLTGQYNARLDLSLYFGEDDATTPENSLAMLPVGIQEFGGVKFDIRGLIQIAPDPDLEPDNRDLSLCFPVQVTGIRLGTRCEKLHFLQAAENAYAEGNPIVARYVLHYADGSSASLPVVLDRDISDWWFSGADSRNPTEAREVWTAKSPAVVAHRRTGHIRLFLSTRLNPYPEKPIESLDFICAPEKCVPFLVALTVE